MVKNTETKVHYVDNKRFFAEMVAYKTAVEKSGDDLPIPDYLGECILKIAQGLSFRPNFINYTYREEMVSDGIENCIRYFRNFDPKKSKNPFSYFTQICYFAFIRRIAKEKVQVAIREKVIDRMDIFDLADQQDVDSRTYVNHSLDQAHNDFNRSRPSKEPKKRHNRNKRGPRGLEKVM